MKSWLPTISLSFASFIFVTSEFTPVGLITEIGQSFGQTESQTGMLMTVYAWIVAALSIPLTAFTARFDRRSLMLSLLGIFTLSHVFSYFATSFNTLIFSRLFVASAHAIFWAIAVPLGIRLAPNGMRERAISIVATGAILGGVLGIPLGTLFGQAYGWRMTFGVIGICAAIIFLILAKLLPATPSKNAGDFSNIIPLMKRKELVLSYMMTMILMTGHYTAYTYISPFLQGVGLMSKESVSGVFLIFGLSSLVTSFYAPGLLKKYFKKASIISISVVAICLFLFKASLTSYPLAILLVVIWGCAFTFISLSIQNIILAAAPDAENIAMAGHSGIYNVGIGGGALIGSITANGSLFAIGYVGSIFVTAATLICIIILKGSFANKMTINSNSAH